jgi:response regulator RpfG family c-di-GMP phosphodiesterase
MSETLPTPAVLLVDDEGSILKSLQRLFHKHGIVAQTAGSGPEALNVLREHPNSFALILSDQRMPVMNGAQFLEQAKNLAPDARRYLLTGYSDLEAVVAAVNRGEIHRFFSKPWNDEELLAAVRESLKQFELIQENRRLRELTQRQNQELSELNRQLEDKVRERTRELQTKNEALNEMNAKLEQSFLETIRFMSALIENLNPKLGKYMRNVAHLSKLVAADLGLGPVEINHVEMAALVHDVGLLGLADRLWERDEKDLTQSEIEQFQNHPIIASVCLDSVEKLSAVSDIVRHHHENMDGSGFPIGLRTEQIPLGAQIIAAVGDYSRILHTWKVEKNFIYSRAKAYLGTAANTLLSESPQEMLHEVATKFLQLNSNKKYAGRITSLLLKHVGQTRAESVHTGSDAPDVLEIDVRRLLEGMVLASDLKLTDGRMLLSRGTRLKMSSIETIRALNGRGLVSRLIWICRR